MSRLRAWLLQRLLRRLGNRPIVQLDSVHIAHSDYHPGRSGQTVPLLYPLRDPLSPGEFAAIDRWLTEHGSRWSEPEFPWDWPKR